MNARAPRPHRSGAHAWALLALVPLVAALAISGRAPAAPGFTCADLPALELSVARLRVSCVSTGNCSTLTGSGSRPSDAIDVCVKSSSSLDACARNVSCTGGVLVCRAMGIAGNDINDAIARCRKISSAGDLCSRNVECSGKGYQVCRSSVFSGHTMEEAIKNCTDTGMSVGICSANVRCESY